MDLSNLKAPKPNKKNRKRIGRGQGSGHGSHTVGRGHNGQRSRSGFKVRFWFEGGQMPLQRRVPKFGFNNRFRTEYAALNVSDIERHIESGKLNNKITVKDLRDAGIISKGELVKLLGDGEITKKVEIEVHDFSESGKKKVEDAGGTVTTVNNN